MNLSLEPPQVHHLAVLVRDLTAAEAFYVGVLGLTVNTRHQGEDGAPRSIWLSLGQGAFLALEKAGQDAARRHDAQPGWHCIALGIAPSERDAWRAQLLAAGTPIERESPYSMYFRDPDGTLLALSHHPHPQLDESADPSTQPANATVTQRLAALLTLSAFLLMASLPAHAQRRAPREPDDVMLIGSSSVNGALGRMIESELETAGLRVERHGRSSTGLARPDFFDWQDEAGELRGLAAMRGVVVYMGGNDTQALRLRREEAPDGTRGEASWVAWRDEARWVEIYTARTHALIDALCEAGAPRVMWVLPTDGDREGWADRIHRIQDAQAAGVRGTACGVVVDPRGLRITDRSTSDGVHLTRTGARDVWRIIGPPLVAGLGSVALAAPAP